CLSEFFFSSRRRHTRSKRDWSSTCALPIFESDGYAAIQVTTGSRKAKHLTKAQAGQFAKAGVEAGRALMEFRLAEGDEAPEVGEIGRASCRGRGRGRAGRAKDGRQANERAT